MKILRNLWLAVLFTVLFVLLSPVLMILIFVGFCVYGERLGVDEHPTAKIY